jgi:acetyl-CoA C-acetyltransferase
VTDTPRSNRPVIVGVGQVANKDDELVLSPVALIERAVHRALDDAGGLPLDLVDAVLTMPTSVFGHNESAEQLAARLGLAPGYRKISGFSGSSPLEMLAKAADMVARGEARAVLVAGGIADASVKRALARGEEPPADQAAPWSQGSEGARDLPERGDWGRPIPEIAAGMRNPITVFSLMESVFAADAGRSFAEQRTFLGSLLAPFTVAAARRPDLAWFPIERTAAEISTLTNENRLVEEPYSKRMTSFPTVDQAAAILVTSNATADSLGLAREKRVYPLSIASCHEPYAPSIRERFNRSVALSSAAAKAFAMAGCTLDDVARFDLYSCFPAAVQLAAASLGLALDDPRGLTVAGGLPYFGGPGPAYVAHSLACIVDECRADTGSIGAAVGLGGMAGHFAVGLLSTNGDRAPWGSDDGADVIARLRDHPEPVDLGREGVATVIAMTISVDRDGVATNAPMVAEFDDGVRTGGRPVSPELARELAGTSLVGTKVRLEERDGQPVYSVA